MKDESKGLTEDYSQMTAKSNRIGVTVVICVYSEQRWKQICAAVESVQDQQPQPMEIIIVVDHNAKLAARVRAEIIGIKVVDSHETPGLSGARNTGLKAATQPVTVFLDDDAIARPGWLAALVEPYRLPNVVSTGGMVYPRWPGSQPRWLPPEFYWVVGCSYRGLPEDISSVRNPIGANMSMRTDLALEVGGFAANIGRVGTRPTGCEETEIAIRLTAGRPGSAILYVPKAAVDHQVAPERLSPGYFLRRCWHEGKSKAVVVRHVGASAGLERERRHVLTVIPIALIGNIREVITGDMGGFPRFITLLAGLSATVAGYLSGRVAAQ